MKPNILKLLTFFLVFFGNHASAQEIWSESFSIPGKGVWGNEDGSTIHSDFERISTWTLDFANVSIASADDYAKTVSTSGGRFECRDINSEVIWRTEEIDISEFSKINIQIVAGETGSGANKQTKYLNVFYKLDDGDEILFETNGENLGNWGSCFAEQKDLLGQKLQVVVCINNHYSADKVILDEVIISGEKQYLEPILPEEILISEVLFNPFSNGNDYVEIYNNSDKQFSSNQLYLASRDKNMELTQIYSLSNEKYMFQPHSYLALTKDTNGVFPFFIIKCPECFLQMEKFPSFNNDADCVVLLDSELQVIDEFYYTDKMHAPLLADEEGVSLERISFAEETNKVSNWHSATTQSGYGTPGYRNSQIQTDTSIKPIVTFKPESFSPNSDGYNDEYKIHYQLDKHGFYINISIFDSAGRFVMHLAKNELLGTSGTYIWNGEDETGQRQNMGVYIVLVEIFDLQGNVHHYKDGLVLTDILE
jgi:hypothetical protein